MLDAHPEATASRLRRAAQTSPCAAQGTQCERARRSLQSTISRGRCPICTRQLVSGAGAAAAEQGRQQHKLAPVGGQYSLLPPSSLCGSPCVCLQGLQEILGTEQHAEDGSIARNGAWWEAPGAISKCWPPCRWRQRPNAPSRPLFATARACSLYKWRGDDGGRGGQWPAPFCCMLLQLSQSPVGVQPPTAELHTPTLEAESCGARAYRHHRSVVPPLAPCRPYTGAILQPEGMLRGRADIGGIMR